MKIHEIVLGFLLATAMWMSLFVVLQSNYGFAEIFERIIAPALLPWIVPLGSMVVLASLVLSIWQGWRWLTWLTISLDQFHSVRKVLALFAVVYAIICAWRLIKNVALPRDLHEQFLPELIAISIFWVLAPPIWFFVEYFAVENDRITNLPRAADPPAPDAPANQAAAALAANEAAKAKYLKTIKDYADYASKIWAGVLALLLALIALKK
jgi:hypothetical protein